MTFTSRCHYAVDDDATRARATRLMPLSDEEGKQVRRERAARAYHVYARNVAI